jgi:Rhodopirellula transposase DDE domain
MATSRPSSSWPPASRSSASTPRRRSWWAAPPTAGGSGNQQASRSGWGVRLPRPGARQGDPYGVYDLGANAGWVSVGTDHDTAAFAVATLGRWWQQAGRALDPTATRLLVTADAGGSNGYRVRAWKTELARLAAETGLEITVCHFPPGTSKWNKVEVRHEASQGREGVEDLLSCAVAAA